MDHRVAIIGYAFRLPDTDRRRYWPDLLQGRNLVTQVDPGRWAQDAYLHPARSHPGTSYSFAAGTIGDITHFDAGFFGISPREAALMDPQQRLLLELCWETMEHAGVKPSAMRGSDCGVYVGVSSVDYSYRLTEDLCAIDSSAATGNATSIVANRLSYVFDLHGPSMVLDTACSSSLVAFHQACQAIRSGETTQAIAGGVSLHVHPYGFVIFSKATMLSPRGRSNAFDASADGYVRSEGAGLFFLKDYDLAVADGDQILAVVAHSAVNTDGRKSGLTVPSADAQTALLRQSYARAGIAADDLDYLEAHGTGTAVGDPIETRAIGEALGKARGHGNPLPIGSVKSNMGHLEAASGAAGLVKVLHCLEHRIVPATIGIAALNPNIDFEGLNIEVLRENRPLKPQGKLTIGLNSFGFGGANAHVILQSDVSSQSDRPKDFAPVPGIPIVLSGKTPEALNASAATFADALENDSAGQIYDKAYECAFRRDWHDHRLIVSGDTPAMLADQLRAFAREGTVSATVNAGEGVPDARGPVFVYSGNGSQWAGMGRRLLEDAVFKQTIQDIDADFRRYADFAIEDELASHHGGTRYEQTEIAQPALFALQVGITRMLKARNVHPVAVIGHSVGEVAAAWASGAVSLSDAVRIIYHRSRLQGTTRGRGRMTAVAASGEEIAGILEASTLSSSLHVAGFNSGDGSTVAGTAGELARLEDILAEQRIGYRRLDLDYAFHSPAMDAIEAGIIESLSDLAPRSTKIPLYSTVTGSVLSGESLGAEYWWRNIRQPVAFHQAIRAMIEHEHFNVFVEIGPHPVLRSYINSVLKQSDVRGRVIVTAARADDDPARIGTAAAQVMLSGATVDWASIFRWRGQRVALPAYPWQREPCWLPANALSPRLLERGKVHPLLGYARPQQSAMWENELDTMLHPWLADHVVGEANVFPGAGFAEIALAAALQMAPDTYADIEELEIHAALPLSAQTTQATRVSVDPQDGRLSIAARELQGSHAWHTHASARIMKEARGAVLDSPVPRVDGRVPAFTASEHYALARRMGLAYGKVFQGIDAGWRDAADIIVARLRAADPADAIAESCHLSPALLDSVFQLVIHFFDDSTHATPDLAYVPTKIGRLTLRTDAGRPHLAQARLLRKSKYSLLAQFTLHDDQGRQIALVDDVRFRAIRLRVSPVEQLAYLDYVATPRPHPANTRPYVNPLNIDAVQAALQKDLADTGDLNSTRRYIDEIDPLLDSLYVQFSLRALRALSTDDNYLAADAIRACCADATDLAPFIKRLISQAVADGFATPRADGWQLVQEDDSPPPEIIWNSLIEEYPDYFEAIYAVGRVGLHLEALLRGTQTHRNACPPVLLPSGFASLRDGADVQAHVAAAIAEAVDHARPISGGRTRIRVLEIGGDAPLAGARCCAVMDFGQCDYCYIGLNDKAMESFDKLRELYPDAMGQTIEALQTSSALYDLAIVHTHFETLGQAFDVLESARARLTPGATLLFIGRHPSRWLDFVFGVRPQWWSSAVDGAVLSTQQPVSFWRAELTRRGWEDPRLLEYVPGSSSGSYLLLTQNDAAVAARKDAPAAAHWLLLVDDEGDSKRLADDLARRFAGIGHRTSIFPCPAGDAVARALAQAETRHGAVQGIIHLAGLAQPGSASGARQAADRLARRCAIAAAAVREREPLEAPPPIWILTRAAAQIGAYAATGSNGLATLDDAALWAFGRTLMNETRHGSIRLIDLPRDVLAVGDALIDELSRPTVETEIIFTPDGSRLAPRLSLLPAPRNRQEKHGDTDTVYRLGFELPGQLRSLRWEAHDAAPPADHEVEVDVRATGLNFRDVMYVLGLLSDEAVENGFTGPALGLEFAGSIRRVGARVEHYRPGDAVVGFGPSSFASRVLTTPDAISLIPSGMSFDAAATIPSTFFTVYYALHHLARLEPGEKLLIHGAAGGIGLAAIQIARWQGVEIFATAGSEDKRDFLRLMGVTHIYDSRSLSFADEILADTQGSGVDAVLNSLAGEAINRNLRILKPFGRYIELGKRDFYENTRIGLRPFRNNISYFGVDADQLMRERPALTHRLFSELIRLFETGALHPLPYRTFQADDVTDAFRHMQQARQIGKIVVGFDSGINKFHDARPRSEMPLRIAPDVTYMVTGGLGGFGLRTAAWLVEKGVKHLMLVSRSGRAAEEAERSIRMLQEQGVDIRSMACDVVDEKAVARVLEYIGEHMPPLKGLVHAATVIDDGLARTLTPARIQAVLAPKVSGAWHLHDLTATLELDHFILFSSATTLFGNPGQSSYVAANGWLEALAQYRRQRGMAATCIRWGAIADVGFLARNKNIQDALQARMGGSALPSEIALRVLERTLLADASGVGVMELDWRALRRSLPSARDPKFDAIACRTPDDDIEDGAIDDIASLVGTLPPEALHARLLDVLKREIGEILRIPVQKIDVTRSIYDLGLDSLMGVELVVALEASTGVRLPVMTLGENATIEKLACRLYAALTSDRAADPDADLQAQLEQAIEQHDIALPAETSARLAAELRTPSEPGAQRMIHYLP